MSQPARALVMFRIDGRVYGAAVRDVRRIGDVRAQPEQAVLDSSPLGEAQTRRRGLVVACGPTGEKTLAVDEVLGVRTIPEADLRPLPAFAAACLERAAVAGFAMLGEQPTVVVDLRAVVGEA